MSSDPNIVDFKRAVSAEVHRHWKLCLTEGIVLIVFGLAAIVASPLATLVVTVLLGWLLLASGIVAFVTTFLRREAPGFGWSLLSALLAVAVGALLLMNPELAAVSLTAVLLVFFIIEGSASLMYARAHQRQMSSGRWRWMVASGVVDLALAAYILYGLPVIAAWALGMMVGVNMVFGGAALIAMAERAHEMNAAHSAP